MCVNLQFFPNSGRINTDVWMYRMDADQTHGEQARRQLHKNAASCREQVQKAVPHKAAPVRWPTIHLENHGN